MYYRRTEKKLDSKRGTMPSADDLTHDAGFVFEGQITQMGASNTDAYPAGPDTAVVRVTRIIKGPDALSGYVNQLITVHLIETGGRQANQQSVFFTHGLHYGEGLVVGEIGVPDTAHAPGAMAAALNASADTQMTQRLAAAELVVTGVASEPRPFTPRAMAVLAE